MRAVLMIALVLVAANVSEASFGSVMKSIFAPIGNIFKTTGKSLLGTLDTIGGQLFDKIKDTGKTLLNQGLQALALNTMNSIKANKGTRELSDLLGKMTEFEGKAHTVLEEAIGVAKPLLTKTISAFHSIIDEVQELVKDPQEIVQKIDNVIGFHNAFADKIMGGIVTELTELAGKMMGHKRGVMETLTGLLGQITSQFKGVFDKVKGMVASTGNVLKQAATGILSNVQKTVGNLAQSLSLQGANVVDSLKKQGVNLLKNAIGQQ